MSTALLNCNKNWDLLIDGKYWNRIHVEYKRIGCMACAHLICKRRAHSMQKKTTFYMSLHVYNPHNAGQCHRFARNYARCVRRSEKKTKNNLLQNLQRIERIECKKIWKHIDRLQLLCDERTIAFICAFYKYVHSRAALAFSIFSSCNEWTLRSEQRNSMALLSSTYRNDWISSVFAFKKE